MEIVEKIVSPLKRIASWKNDEDTQKSKAVGARKQKEKSKRSLKTPSPRKPILAVIDAVNQGEELVSIRTDYPLLSSFRNQKSCYMPGEMSTTTRHVLFAIGKG